MAFRSYENDDLAALKDLIWIKDNLEYQLNIRFDRSLFFDVEKGDTWINTFIFHYNCLWLSEAKREQ